MSNSDFRIRSAHLINDPKIINTSRKEVTNEFKNVLADNLKSKDKLSLENANFKISAHAKKRMDERKISLPEEDIKLIDDAFRKLENKGARESLILYKDMGLISSVVNKTIITAIDQSELDVVTNIDSAILIR